MYIYIYIYTYQMAAWYLQGFFTKVILRNIIINIYIYIYVETSRTSESRRAASCGCSGRVSKEGVRNRTEPVFTGGFYRKEVFTRRSKRFLQEGVGARIQRFLQEWVRARTEPAELNRTAPCNSETGRNQTRNRTEPSHDASEKRRPNHVEPVNHNFRNRTEPNDLS